MLILNKSEGQRAKATGPQEARVNGGERSPLANLVEVAASIELGELREVALQHLYKLIANLVGLDQTQGTGQLCFLASKLGTSSLDYLCHRNVLGSTLRSALLILKHLSDAAHGVEILGFDGFYSRIHENDLHISNLSLLRYVQ